jgi:hypothetical protein
MGGQVMAPLQKVSGAATATSTTAAAASACA